MEDTHTKLQRRTLTGIGACDENNCHSIREDPARESATPAVSAKAPCLEKHVTSIRATARIAFFSSNMSVSWRRCSSKTFFRSWRTDRIVQSGRACRSLCWSLRSPFRHFKVVGSGNSSTETRDSERPRSPTTKRKRKKPLESGRFCFYPNQLSREYPVHMQHAQVVRF